ncbi:MAG: hypothetical protein LBK47_01570 [Prevotellaceae bacterium]|jgi:hypothetical protein|nr:hypothetical protein [Prevotellaceae bacterium]
MKQFRILALLLALAGLTLVTSCSTDDSPTAMDASQVNPSLLIGKWRNDQSASNYKKYTTTTRTLPGGDDSYDKYGSDWTIGETTEDQVGTEFYYKVDGNQIKEQYDNAGTPLTRIYTLMTLTSTKLEYFDHFDQVYSFTKQ